MNTIFNNVTLFQQTNQSSSFYSRDKLINKKIRIWCSNTLPTGYGWCDGTNGTPDLRDKFIIGINPTTHNLQTIGDNSFNSFPSHTHTLNHNFATTNVNVNSSSGINIYGNVDFNSTTINLGQGSGAGARRGNGTSSIGTAIVHTHDLDKESYSSRPTINTSSTFNFTYNNQPGSINKSLSNDSGSSYFSLEGSEITSIIVPPNTKSSTFTPQYIYMGFIMKIPVSL